MCRTGVYSTGVVYGYSTGVVYFCTGVYSTGVVYGYSTGVVYVLYRCGTGVYSTGVAYMCCTGVVYVCTGVSISALDETTYQVFAPSRVAMDEAKENIDELLTEEVCYLILANK